MMCCQPNKHGHSMMSHAGCCSDEGKKFSRRFITKAEKISMLEEYKEELQKELNGVEEHIKTLKSS